MNRILVLILLIASVSLNAQDKTAPKPLYDDPVYHGAADPVIVYNKKLKKWWMFYTNRRASLNDSSGVAWLHGTKIGYARNSFDDKRSVIQVAELKYDNGLISCDRDAKLVVKLKHP